MRIITSVDLTSNEPIKTGGYICIELDAILKAVCYVNNVNIFDVKGKRRFEELVIARREYCYLARELTNETQWKIGAEINLSHDNVYFHCKKVLQWLNVKGYRLKEKLELIEKQLKI